MTPGISTGMTTHSFPTGRATGAVSSGLCTSCVGCDVEDADGGLGGSDRARGVRAVTVVILPGGRSGVRSAADARDAVDEVDVLHEVGVRPVDAGVDVAGDHARAAPRDRMRVKSLDLVHVPLQRGEAVAPGRRRVTGDPAGAGSFRGAGVQLVVLEAGREPGRRDGPVA